MTVETLQAAIAVVGLVSGSSLVGGVVWAIRQEGRINGHDLLFEEREKKQDERHQETIDRLQRIETYVLELKRNGSTAR